MSKQYHIFLLFGLMLLALFFPLSITPLFDLDEGAFSEATREMLVGKDYITTYLNGELRFDKPILIYWLQLVSIKVFGLNEFSVRFPSAIAGAFWVFVVYFFAKRNFNERVAFFTAIFMISSLQINIIAKASIADALLNLFIALSMFSIYDYFKTREKKFLYFTFIWIALGVLTKGPVAILIPFMVSLLFFSINREFKEWLKVIFNPIGILLFLLIAMPWYIAEYLAQKQAFIDGFFLKHNINRFSSPMEKHNGTIFYFIPVLLIGLMPFTYFFIKSFKNLKSYFKEPLKLYLLIWFSFVFLFFSFSGTKLPHYIIYGYTPIFILGALSLKEGFSKEWIIFPTLFLISILFFLPEIATYFQADIKDELAQVLIKEVYSIFNNHYKLFLGVMAILLFILLFRKKEETILVTAVIFIFTINYLIIPSYGQLMQQPIKEAGFLAKEKKYKDIVMYKVNTPSFNFYYEGLVLKREPIKGDIVFTKVPKLKKFKSYSILYKKRGFALIRVNSL